MTRARAATAISVVSVTSVTPDDVMAVEVTELTDTYFVARSMRLTGITVTGTQAPGVGAQAHVGILKAGASAWEGELISPYLDGGEFVTWEGSIRLDEGDTVQVWASVTGVLDVTVETEED
jgi:hypothetical protein